MDLFSVAVVGIVVIAFAAIVMVNIVTKGRGAMKPGQFPEKNTDIQDTTHG